MPKVKVLSAPLTAPTMTPDDEDDEERHPEAAPGDDRAALLERLDHGAPPVDHEDRPVDPDRLQVHAHDDRRDQGESEQEEAEGRAPELWMHEQQERQPTITAKARPMPRNSR